MPVHFSTLCFSEYSHGKFYLLVVHTGNVAQENACKDTLSRRGKSEGKLIVVKEFKTIKICFFNKEGPENISVVL